MTSDYLFAPKHKPGDYSKDDDHMAQIIELLGDLPDHRKHGGNYSKQIFRSNGTISPTSCVISKD
jgi:serine/threonine-protein kinase SRPK3